MPARREGPDGGARYLGRMRTTASLLLSLTAIAGAVEPAAKAVLPAPIVADGATPLWVPSGYMGETSAIAMDGESTDSPHSGATCLKVSYAKGDGWGGVVWQHPANDWGSEPGGFDLTGAKKLTFWARGAEGGESVKFGFGVIGSDKPYADSGKSEQAVTLTKEWKEYTIDVASLTLTRVKTGFMWVIGGKGKPVTFYVDDAVWQ